MISQIRGVNKAELPEIWGQSQHVKLSLGLLGIALSLLRGLNHYLCGKDGSLHHSEVFLVQHLVHVWEAPPAR